MFVFHLESRRCVKVKGEVGFESKPQTRYVNENMKICGFWANVSGIKPDLNISKGLLFNLKLSSNVTFMRELTQTQFCTKTT